MNTTLTRTLLLLAGSPPTCVAWSQGTAGPLPPKAVAIVELHQLEQSEPIYLRADLALAAREIEVRDGRIYTTNLKHCEKPQRDSAWIGESS